MTGTGCMDFPEVEEDDDRLKETVNKDEEKDAEVQERLTRVPLEDENKSSECGHLCSMMSPAPFVSRFEPFLEREVGQM